MECWSVTTALALSVVSLLAYWIWKSQKALTVWETLRVPGPTPSLLFGNVGEMRKKGFCSCFVEWGQEYGKVYGIYFPKTPCLVVSDLDFLRDVMIKNFGSFRNRQTPQFMKFKPWEDTLLQLKDDHWKHIRSQLSPTFSSGKLKKMMPAIVHVVQNLNRHIGEKAKRGEEVELKEVALCFTMDTIAGAAFGMQVDSISNPKEPFNVNGIALLNTRTWLYPVFFVLPWLEVWLRRLFDISVISVKSTNFFLDVINLALKERRMDTKTYGDFLQLLVETEREGTAGPVDKEIDHSDQLVTSSKWERKGMNDDEIGANAFLFLLGGYDNVSKVLSFTLFFLAANPDTQKKAQKEVDSKIGKNLVTYETAGDLPYMDMCVNESMRLFPPGFILDREVSEDCEVRGYPLKKGMRVLIPAYSIHRDPSYWPDPEKFDPERHSLEGKASRHPMAFMPFGHGPRNCIGMRLAQLEIRMAIASLLQNFDIHLTDKSVYPPVLKHPQVQVRSKDGLLVKFTPRK